MQSQLWGNSEIVVSEGDPLQHPNLKWSQTSKDQEEYQPTKQQP